VNLIPFPGQPSPVAASITAAQSDTAPLPGAFTMARLIELAVAGCPSPHTRRAYSTQLSAFIASGQPLNRDGVSLHLKSIRDRGKKTAARLACAAIRKLAVEAHCRQLLTDHELAGIQSVKPAKEWRTRAGQWLTVEQAQQLLGLADRTTYWGARDACLLSISLGCGLRRAEVCALKWDQYQMREGRPCLVDLVGKGDKRRTIPVPRWVIGDVNRWKQVSRQRQPIEHIPIQQRNLLQHQRVYDPDLIAGGLSDSQLWRIVIAYGQRMGLKLAPHDLRRTLARLMRQAGSDLEQIQLTLGHSSIETTISYLGSQLALGLDEAAVDKLGMEETI
jgi:integrase/recombinase XerD